MRLWHTLLLLSLSCLYLNDAIPQQDVDQRRLGLVPVDPSVYRGVHTAAPPLGGASLPSSIDLSASFPGPQNQGQQDSCTAWALGYAIRSYQQDRLQNVSRQQTSSTYLSQADHQFSPSYLFKRTKITHSYPNSGCTGGISIPDALAVLQSEGVTTMQDFRYDPISCDAVPSPQNIMNASRFKIAGWSKVGNDYNNIDVDVMRALLAAGFPIAVGIKVDDAFLNLKGATYSQYVGPFKGFHALAVIGYDDDQRAFLIQNSWGPTWASNGKAWIPYQVSQAIMTEAYVSQDAGLPPPQVWPEVKLHLGGGARRVTNNWVVIVASTEDLLSAQKKALDINARFEGFLASIYTNTGETGSYAVAIGTNLPRDRAVALKEKAVESGLSKDIIVSLPH